MSTRTDALVSQRETGKMAASIIPVVAGCHRRVLVDNAQDQGEFNTSHRLQETDLCCAD
jgi:hypothetical protein